MKQKKTSAAYQRGRRQLAHIHGERGLAAIDSMADLAPDLCRMVYEWPFAEIYTRPALDLKSRQLVTLSALAAMGNARPQLKAHIHGSMNMGWTAKEIVEVFMQLSIYAGFPSALNALQVAREVFNERNVMPPAGHGNEGKARRRKP